MVQQQFKESTIVIIDTGKRVIKAGRGLHDLLPAPTVSLQARVGLRKADATRFRNGTGAMEVEDPSASSSLPLPKGLRPSNYLVGHLLDEAIAAGEDVELWWPFDNGSVKDWTQAEALWKYVLFQGLHLRRTLNEFPVLLSLPKPLSFPAYQTLAQVFFERFNVAAFSVFDRAVVQIFAANQTSGIVVEGRKVTVGKERHRMCEPLLDSDLVKSYVRDGLKDELTCMTLPAGINAASRELDLPIRAVVWEAIQVAGKLGRAKTFGAALTSHLRAYVARDPAEFGMGITTDQPKSFRVVKVPEYFAHYREIGDELAGFLGASIVAKTGLGIAFPPHPIGRAAHVLAATITPLPMHLLQALSCIPKRLFRFIVPLTLFFLFSFLLTFIFVLYHPPRAPGRFQRLSWQKWDVVSLNPDGTLPGGSNPPKPGNWTNTDGKEWWQLDELDAGEAPASVSLPLDVWSPLLPHSTGLTEIAIKSCILPPDIVDWCAPKSTPEEDALKGKWVRVGRDLNFKTGMWYLSIYYRRTRRLDVPLITDIHFLRANESISSLPGAEQTWVRAAGDLHDGVPSEPPLRLYYQLRRPLAGIPEAVEIRDLVTEIDVLYGLGDRVPWGFQRVNIPVVDGKEGRKGRDAVWVVFRKGMKRPPRAKPLHFSDDGKFKILQVADLHYSVSQGRCRDVDPQMLPPYLSAGVSAAECKGDTLTRTLLAQTLELEKPSLVVFTGDQLNGQDTSWDSTSVILKAIGEVIDAKIPWAVVFGNHDDERTDLDRTEQMRVLTRMPYAVREMEEGPSWVDGVGNWWVAVKSPDPSATHLLTLYFLDSHAYDRSNWAFWKPPEYDWLKQSQIDWYLQQSASISPIERPFTPDGAKDLGQVWPANVKRDKTLAKPNAMMFFHIPLPESYSTPDISSSGEVLSYGEKLEGTGSPSKNSGFFEKALQKSAEREGPGSPREVKVVANGHCHLTDECKRVGGVWLCFGGGGSFSGYGKLGFDRRFRVYEISDFGETIRTYKRLQDGSVSGELVLVGNGAVGNR
ncbi:hypothetical protein FRB99_000346 [Tulasnella sp. 403]|nr:hypothetical protein FRB99_000346 [Tulasnella sp. 403]